MSKKIVIILLAILFIIIINFYNSQRTVECWWGTVYPSLSFIAIEDEEEKDTGKISSLNNNYFYLNEEPIKIKIAIVEWFKKYF